MTALEFLLEEPSARELLKGIVPKIVHESVQVHYLVFDGKQDLEKNIVKRLRGWQAPDSSFVVLRDQDAAQCIEVKARLAGLVADSKRSPALVRVACRELVSWVLGDMAAVATAFDEPKLEALARKAKYREPDSIVRPIETLRGVVPEYQKVDGARRVGCHMDLERSASMSFRAFVSGLRKLMKERGPAATVMADGS